MSTTSPARIPSPAEMNLAAREFYKAETAKFWERLDDPVIREGALRRMKSELDRHVDSYFQMTFEAALADAEEEFERCKPVVRKADGSSGGRPVGGDALQRLIETIVQERPTITRQELLDWLKAEAFGGVIEAVENGTVLFREADEQKECPVTGLKDRLRRAKQGLAAQKPV